MAKDKGGNFKKSYSFFHQKAENNSEFDIEELANYAGWKEGTARTYISKKWDNIIKKLPSGKYKVVNISQFSEDEYLRMMSQNNRSSQDPFKPQLSEDVESLVIKARESALLALDIYNRPLTSFKSEGFIVMMIIAWTSLLHSIFERDNKKYNYLDDDGNDKMIDGDLKCWELNKCVLEFFGSSNNAVRSNMEFMIGLRNKIEHRFAPKIDNHVGGECQALILNFDEILTKEYGNYYSLKELLVFPLQTSNLRHEATIEAIKKFQGKHYHDIKEYIDVYRDKISDEIYNDPKYSFRVFLMPKLGNHKSSSDVAMEFVPFDKVNTEELEAFQKHITLIKEKNIQVANQGKFKPTFVVEQVKSRINKPFTIHKHTAAFKFYKIRTGPKSCNVEYCQYDEPHKDYIYTQKWIDFLVERLSNEEEYNKIISYKG